MVDPERLYTGAEVAGMLRVSVRTVESWRANGRGPRWMRYEGNVRYPGRFLQSYINGWRAVSRLESDVSKEGGNGSPEGD